MNDLLFDIKSPLPQMIDPAISDMSQYDSGRSDIGHGERSSHTHRFRMLLNIGVETDFRIMYGFMDKLRRGIIL